MEASVGYILLITSKAVSVWNLEDVFGIPHFHFFNLCACL